MIAKCDLSAEALMINKDRTKYHLLSAKDYYSCKNTHVHYNQINFTALMLCL